MNPGRPSFSYISTIWLTSQSWSSDTTENELLCQNDGNFVIFTFTWTNKTSAHNAWSISLEIINRNFRFLFHLPNFIIFVIYTLRKISSARMEFIISTLGRLPWNFDQSLLLFNDNKIKIAWKPGKKQKENPVRCTKEGERWKGNIRERSREGKTVIVVELSLEVRWPLWSWLSQESVAIYNRVYLFMFFYYSFNFWDISC